MSETARERLNHTAGENTGLFEDFSDPEVVTQPGEEGAGAPLAAEISFNSMEKSRLIGNDTSPPGSFTKPKCPNPSNLKCPKITLKDVWKWTKTNLLLLLTIASVLVGAIIGISVREVDMPRESEGYRLMVTLIGFPGEIFLRMLKMLILPLIIFSLISGLGSLETKVAGSLGWKTVLYYGTTTVLAVVLGLILVSAIKPGGRDIPLMCNNASVHAGSHELEVIDSVLDLVRYVV